MDSQEQKSGIPTKLILNKALQFILSQIIQQNMPHTYYFITLKSAPGRTSTESHAEWQLLMEGLWEETLSKSQKVSADDYCVRGAQLYAIAAVSGDPALAETILLETLQQFTERTASPPIQQQWRTPYKLRRLNGRSELSASRDFIVQCILGDEFNME
jgi:hypothetical protein